MDTRSSRDDDCARHSYQNAADIRTDLQRLKRDSDRMAVEAAEAGVKPARKSTRWAVTGATILVIGLAVGGWLFFSRKAHARTDKDTIVLALGVYFSAAAGSYAIGNLFPHLYMPAPGVWGVAAERVGIHVH